MKGFVKFFNRNPTGTLTREILESENTDPAIKDHSEYCNAYNAVIVAETRLYYKVENSFGPGVAD